MFIGENAYLISAQGTVVIPPKFMSEFRGVRVSEAYITKSPSRCLYLFPKENWKIVNWKIVKRKFEEITRLEEVKIRKFNGSWRVSILKDLREHAKLERKVVVVGCGDYIEIWDEKRWRKEKKKIEKMVVKEEVFSEIKII